MHNNRSRWEYHVYGWLPIYLDTHAECWYMVRCISNVRGEYHTSGYASLYISEGRQVTYVWVPSTSGELTYPHKPTVEALGFTFDGSFNTSPAITDAQTLLKGQHDV